MAGQEWGRSGTDPATSPLSPGGAQPINPLRPRCCGDIAVFLYRRFPERHDGLRCSPGEHGGKPDSSQQGDRSGADPCAGDAAARAVRSGRTTAAGLCRRGFAAGRRPVPDGADGPGAADPDGGAGSRGDRPRRRQRRRLFRRRPVPPVRNGDWRRIGQGAGGAGHRDVDRSWHRQRADRRRPGRCRISETGALRCDTVRWRGAGLSGDGRSPVRRRRTAGRRVDGRLRRRHRPGPPSERSSAGSSRSARCSMPACRRCRNLPKPAYSASRRASAIRRSTRRRKRDERERVER